MLDYERLKEALRERYNEEFEVLVFEDAFGYQFGPYATEKYVLNGSSNRLCLVKGDQLQERLLERKQYNQ